MEPHKEYSENDATDRSKVEEEYGNNPAGSTSDYTGNDDFGASDTTTGSGYSEKEREDQDGTSGQDEDKHSGASDLIDHYNINDQAHSDSSKDDFVRTVSNFKHNDDTLESDDPQPSRH